MVKAAAATTAVARRVRPDQLSASTPCRDWDVRALANHLTIWSAFASELIARKEPMPADGSLGAGRDFTGEGWAGRYADQVDRAVTAWSRPAAWEGMTEMGGAPLPAQLAGGLMLAELLIHGWDLAVATGQELRCDDDVAVAVDRIVAETAAQGREYRLFDPEVAVPDSAPPLAHALALSGRDPHWSPSTNGQPAASGSPSRSVGILRD